MRRAFSIIGVTATALLFLGTACTQKVKAPEQGSSETTNNSTGTQPQNGPQNAPDHSSGQNTQTQPTPDPVGELFLQFNSQLDAAKTNQAKQLLVDAIDDPAFAERRAEVFSALLRFLCFINDVEDARNRYLAVLDSDPELATAALGVIYRKLTTNDDPEAIREWALRLLQAEALRPKAPIITEWLFRTYMDAADWDGLLAIAPEKLSSLPAYDSAAALSRLIQSAMRSASPEIVDKTLVAVEGLSANVPAAKAIVSAAHAEIAARRQQWDKVEEKFIAAAKLVDDAELEALIRNLGRRLKSAGRTDLIDAICQYTFDVERRKKGSMRAAAQIWMDVPQMREDRGAVPVRLNELLQLGIDPNQLYRYLNSNFYFALDENAPNTLKALLDFSERLLPLIDNEQNQGRIKTMILDAAFVAGDYDRTIKIIESGIPGQDENWQGMHLCKVRGHKAEREKRFKDAANYFREFMKYIEDWEEGQRDPSTGTYYTPEMTLGRNAIRVGKLLLKAGDTEGAQAAFNEAREYFAQARKDPMVKPESAETKVIAEELATIPAVEEE